MRIDYLIVDMPPGTGDVALSLGQTVPVAGRVVVTTPQTVSVADTRRAVRMYQKLNVPTLGLIENMSHFVCPTCHHESDIFGKGGGEMLAKELSVPFLGRIPLYEPIRRRWRYRCSDRRRRTRRRRPHCLPLRRGTPCRADFDRGLQPSRSRSPLL